jgi:hypothetical protein
MKNETGRTAEHPLQNITMFLTWKPFTPSVQLRGVMHSRREQSLPIFGFGRTTPCWMQQPWAFTTIITLLLLISFRSSQLCWILRTLRTLRTLRILRTLRVVNWGAHIVVGGAPLGGHRGGHFSCCFEQSQFAYVPVILRSIWGSDSDGSDKPISAWLHSCDNSFRPVGLMELLVHE